MARVYQTIMGGDSRVVVMREYGHGEHLVESTVPRDIEVIGDMDQVLRYLRRW